MRPRFKLGAIRVERAIDEKIILPMGEPVLRGDFDLAEKPGHAALKLLPLRARRIGLVTVAIDAEDDQAEVFLHRGRQRHEMPLKPGFTAQKAGNRGL